MTAPTTIVLGARTRAGQAVADRATSRGERAILLARHAADSAALAGSAATVLRIDTDLELLGAEVGDGPVLIAVCALGPVHPDEGTAEGDTEAFVRDLAAVERVLAASTGRPTSIVLVSSVIALAPGPDRRYYGGFKSLVEQRLAQVVASTAPAATFAVVYPGRLVEKSSRSVLGLHTSYQRLAATIGTMSGTSRGRVSGLDARLWLAANGARLLLSTILPPRASAVTVPLELPLSVPERNGRP